MAPPIDHKAVWAVVRHQRGAISLEQLLGLNLTRDAIRHRIRRGRLTREWPGVYRVGPLPLTREGRFMAAILACGEDAALSHDSAAALWGIRMGGTNPIHVSVPANRRIRLEGIQPHRRNPMPETTTLGPIPLSQPLFTLIDLAAELDTDALEAAINEADKRALIRFDEIDTHLAGTASFPGIAKLRATLHRYTRTDSNLERRFLAIVRKARLPPPATQEHLGLGRIDFHWPELGLVVETDGLTYHRTPIQQLADRARDQAHAAAGRTQLRFANIQIRESPGHVALTLKQVVDRLRAR